MYCQVCGVQLTHLGQCPCCHRNYSPIIVTGPVPIRPSAQEQPPEEPQLFWGDLVSNLAKATGYFGAAILCGSIPALMHFPQHGEQILRINHFVQSSLWGCMAAWVVGRIIYGIEYLFSK